MKKKINESDFIAGDKTAKTASQFVVAAWFLGLAYFYWFDSNIPTLSFITNILLVVVGMFATSIIFGMGFNFVGRLIAKILTGRWEAFPNLNILMGIISSAVTFFSVKYIIIYLI